MVKLVAWLIVLAMIVTSFSFVLILPGLFGSTGSVVYAGTSDDEFNQQMANLKQYIEYKKRITRRRYLRPLVKGAFSGL
jgi:hypothetical protein